MSAAMPANVTSLPEAELAPCGSGSALSIASYNVHRCVGRDGKTDVARVARVIAEMGCDTIGLQEVDHGPGPASDSVQLGALARLLGMSSVAGPTVIEDERHFGNALLTRREIVDVRRHNLTYSRREPRGVLDVDLRAGDRSVRVIVTHLGLRAAERRHQVRRLVALLEASPADEPLVLLGDFNEWLRLGRPLRWLHRMLGWTPAAPTFPAWRPLVALDRVWVRPRAALTMLAVHRSPAASTASDHLPVKALIALGASER